MTDFLRSGWSVLPLVLWWIVWLPYAVVSGVRGRRWDRRLLAVAREGRMASMRRDLPALRAVDAEMDQLLAEIRVRRSRSRVAVHAAAVVCLLMLVRLPFSLGWV